MDIPLNSRHGLILTRDLERLALDDRQLRRRVADGSIVRVAHGSYMPAAAWQALTFEQQHLARAHAFNEASVTRHVFSHFSAAVVLGIPIVGPLPRQVHVTVERFSRTRFRHHVVGHYADVEPTDIEEHDGLLVTAAARTVADLALSTTFPTAVAAVDWYLSCGHDRGILLGILDGMPPRTGRRRAIAAVEFGDGRSGSPGESLSRANIHLLRLPAPDLQVPFTDAAGLIGIADFWWEASAVIGEFDGAVKYSRDEYTHGREAAEIVLREKRRADRMRGVNQDLVRWGWDVASDLRLLGDLLGRHGLRSA